MPKELEGAPGLPRLRRSLNTLSCLSSKPVGYLFSRCDSQVDVRSHHPTRFVSERYVAEFDITPQPEHHNPPFPVRHLALYAHDLSYPLGPHTGLAEQIRGARQPLHRVVQASDIGEEQDYIPGGELLGQHALYGWPFLRVGGDSTPFLPGSRTAADFSVRSRHAILSD